VKVFWSWQSDTPRKTGRFLVRDAIAAAIQKLKQAEDIEEPTDRQRLDSLHLDQDRQGLPGSPDLAEAIFKKIDAAAVVIADVTIVARAKGKTNSSGKRIKGRAFINPNVGIEVGYAMKARGDDNLLLAVNTYHGPTEDLPFDLRHKGISLVYNLADDATKAEIEQARDKLTATLMLALRHYINMVPASAQELEAVRQPSKIRPAFFFEAGQTLARIGVPGEDEIQFSMETDRALYMRLIPTRRRSTPLTPRKLSESASTLGTLWIRQDYSPHSNPNELGHIVFRPEGSHGPNIVALSQAFPTGEVWGINKWLVRDREEGQGLILPALPFETTYYDTFRRYVKFVSDIGVEPPIVFDAGLVGITGFSIARDYGLSYGPFHKDEIVCEYVLHDLTDKTLDNCLLKFFELVYDHTPYGRPPNDWGFPPGPPRERQ